MDVKGNIVFLQEGDYKICLPFLHANAEGWQLLALPSTEYGIKRGKKNATLVTVFKEGQVLPLGSRAA